MTEPALEVALRRVRPDDWRAHRDLRLEMLLDAPDAFFTQHSDVAPFGEREWRDRIGAQWHVQARLADDPVGSVGLYEDAGVATLVAMYVSPRARGRGVGERLVQAVLDEAAARGHDHVVLEVTSGNDAAEGLYRRMGFARTGAESPHPRRPDLVELTLRRDLQRDADTAVRDPDPTTGPGRGRVTP